MGICEFPRRLASCSAGCRTERNYCWMNCPSDYHEKFWTVGSEQKRLILFGYVRDILNHERNNWMMQLVDGRECVLQLLGPTGG